MSICNSQRVVFRDEACLPVLYEILLWLRNGYMGASDSAGDKAMFEVKFRKIELMDFVVYVRQVKNFKVVDSVIAKR